MFSQLAPASLHSDQRFAHIHLSVLRLHILSEPAMCLLLISPPDTLRFIMPLVRSLLLRFQQQLV
jgi:hypothetical protein